MKNNSEVSNRLFKNFASFLSIEKGIEPALAKNLIRWHMNQKKSAARNKVWLDPKTGLPLSREQWMGPSQKLAEKVARGTREGFYSVEDYCRFGACAGMYLRKGVLLDGTLPETVVFVTESDIP